MKTKTQKAVQAECKRLLEQAARLVSGKAPQFGEALDCIDAARHLTLRLGGKPARVVFLPRRAK